MLYFIIPLIHPLHKKIKNFLNINLYLKNTINNLLSIDNTVKIIIIGYKKPIWINFYKSVVIFIEIDGNLLDILRKLDDNTDTITKYNNNKLYKKYLNMDGKFHNKDKGFKYFIGLLFISQLNIKNQPMFIGLIDADDYIRKDILSILNKQSIHKNEFYINNGYILFSEGNENNVIKSIYKTNKFTNICGSNRFYRFPYLRNILIDKLKLNQIKKNTLYNLINNYKCNNKLIINILNLINKSDSWKILPSFLGIHRLYYPNNKLTSKFHRQFNRVYLNDFLAIKLIHNDNHSSSNTICDQSNIINRYKHKKIILKNSIILNHNKIIQEFNIFHFKNTIIQNSQLY